MARSVGLVALVLLVAVGCSKQNDVEATSNVCGDNTLDCIPCASGEYRCDGATLKVCQSDGQGFDSVSVCVSEALCVKGLPSQACAVPVCNAADTKCEGAIMWVCSQEQDEYVDTECSSVESCTAGLASGKCAAGECAGPTDCTGVDTACRKRTCDAGTCGFLNEPADTPCETNRVCDGAGNCVGQCNLPSDCTGVDTECRKRTCDAGVCGFENIAQGTAISSQTAADCKKMVCDGLGGTEEQVDASDKPDDNNDCTVESCNGATPSTSWAPLGTPCQGDGVCDGQGNCNPCSPGDTRCNGGSLQTCIGTGQWDTGTACPDVCDSVSIPNQCGVCWPGAKQCMDSTTSQVCAAHGQWQADPCPAVCIGAGECAECVPGSHQCSGGVRQTCDTSGAWQDDPCTFVCSGDGQCTGECVPGSKRCGGTSGGPQICDADGFWQDDTPCPVAAPFCSGNGVCGCPGTGGPSMVGVPGGYCIDTTEVTRAQYQAWMNTNPSTSGQPAYCSWNNTFTPDPICIQSACQSDCENHPQVCADWCDAYAYCKAVGKRLCGRIGGGATPWGSTNTTDNQWYNACSSGQMNNYPYGDTYDGLACNGTESGAYTTTLEVGSLTSCQSSESGYEGVYDLSGNVTEWVDECNGTLGSGDSCFVRGGAFAFSGHLQLECGSSITESGTEPRDGLYYGLIGFRCCSDP